MAKLKLTLELVPVSTWGQSLAQLLPQPVWDTVRREVYSNAGYQCEVCDTRGVVLHAHEIWEYDDRKRVQKLVGFICLCEDCHAIKHWGRTTAMANAGKLPRDYVEELKKHFCKVNNCSRDDFENHVVQSMAMSHKRNRKIYKIDWGIFHPEKIKDRWRKQAKK